MESEYMPLMCSKATLVILTEEPPYFIICLFNLTKFNQMNKRQMSITWGGGILSSENRYNYLK